MSENEEIASNPDVAEAGSVESAIEQATDAVAVQVTELDELSAQAAQGDAMELSKLLDVPVEVTIEIGRTQMSLGELVRTTPGSLLELNRQSHEPADILVNGKVVARGEIVTIDKNYGVRITKVES